MALVNCHKAGEDQVPPVGQQQCGGMALVCLQRPPASLGTSPALTFRSPIPLQATATRLQLQWIYGHPEVTKTNVLAALRAALRSALGAARRLVVACLPRLVGLLGSPAGDLVPSRSPVDPQPAAAS